MVWTCSSGDPSNRPLTCSWSLTPGPGAVNGRTGIIVNDTNPGAGALNQVGIPLVYVQSGQTKFGNFVIDPLSSHFDPSFGGVINKGLFIYYLNLKAPPGAPAIRSAMATRPVRFGTSRASLA